jgi:hypothetical protein
MGVFAHATHFVLLPALAGLLMLTYAMERGGGVRLVGAGAMLGVAVLMKQHALVFAALALGLLAWHDRRASTTPRTAVIRGALLLAGVATPFALLLAVLGVQGVLGRFWFWTFQYAKAYVSEIPVSASWPMLVAGWNAISRATLPWWLLAALGLALLWLTHRPAAARAFLTGLLIAAFLGICPGFFFREHYFILLLPAVALLVGVAVDSVVTLLRRVTPPMVASVAALALLGLALVAYAVEERRYLVSMGGRELSRTRYGANPFVEAVEIGRYLREHTAPGDRIAVVGSEPEIYFYARRRAATGYLYTYALMEPQPYAARMQGEMIAEIEAAHPAYVVFVGIASSWLARPASDRLIFDWINRYLSACYERVGVADIQSMDTTAMVWDAAAAGYTPRSSFVVSTLRRTSAAPCAAGG